MNVNILTDLNYLSFLFQPNIIFKGIFLFLIVCHLIFMVVVFAQIRSMEKVITQPLSSAVLGFFCLVFIASSIGLAFITIHLP